MEPKSNHGLAINRQHNPSRSVDYSIVSETEIIRHTTHDFRANTNDPSFTIKLDINPQVLKERDSHIRMIVSIETPFDRANSELYLSEGDGYSQENCISRYHSWGECQEYIIHRKYTSSPIRFDPVDRPGEFSIRHFYFYIWSSKASKMSIIRDFSRRLLDPTKSADDKGLNIQSGLISKTFDEGYKIYMTSPSELLHDPYSLWAKYVETSRRSRWASRLKNHTSEVKFSILMPTYNTDPIHLEECIESVIRQTYGNWELCIVDDGSSNEETLNTLLRYDNLDDRIRLSRRSTNGHICIATNEALTMATGDRSCFLDHDDYLAPDALEIIADIISTNSDLELIYSDEDFIDPNGNRISPHFKPDWNQDLLFSHNYITHFVCVKTEKLRALGGLRTGTEGSQDYDLMLRYTNNLESSKIYHIPEILYHWRISETSTASSSSAKPYTVEAGKKALEDALLASNTNSSVHCMESHNFYEVRRDVVDPASHMVSIIIPTRNCYSLLRTCIESIISKTAYRNYEILIVDNESDDLQTVQYLESFSTRSDTESKVRILRFNEPFNYSRINNFACNSAKGDLICLLNNDTEVIEPNWLEYLVSHAQRPDVGCVGAKLLYEDDTIQHAGVILSLGGYAGHSHKGLANHSLGYFMRPHLIQEVSAVTGACLMIRTSLYKEVNGLDEILFPIAYNDVDLCLKAKSMGLRNIYAANAVLYHYESKSRGYEDTPEKKKRFQKEQQNLFKTWGYLLREDPFYNPNLTKDREDFSIRVS